MNKNKNFGLSPDDFEKLVTDLKKNEPHFFEQVFLHHFKECLIYIKKEYHANHDDAYDRANASK